MNGISVSRVVQLGPFRKQFARPSTLLKNRIIVNRRNRRFPSLKIIFILEDFSFYCGIIVNEWHEVYVTLGYFTRQLNASSSTLLTAYL